eukprot:scaffold304_cov409-Prasinococcus_capsulatus_cf.AAC.8
MVRAPLRYLQDGSRGFLTGSASRGSSALPWQSKGRGTAPAVAGAADQSRRAHSNDARGGSTTRAAAGRGGKEGRVAGQPAQHGRTTARRRLQYCRASYYYSTVPLHGSHRRAHAGGRGGSRARGVRRALLPENGAPLAAEGAHIHLTLY